MKKKLLLTVAGLSFLSTAMGLHAVYFEEDIQLTSAPSIEINQMNQVPTAQDYEEFKEFVWMKIKVNPLVADELKRKDLVLNLLTYFEEIFHSSSSSHLVLFKNKNIEKTLSCLSQLTRYIEDIGTNIRYEIEENRIENRANAVCLANEIYQNYLRSPLHKNFKIFQYLFEKVVSSTPYKHKFEKGSYGTSDTLSYHYVRDNNGIIPIWFNYIVCDNDKVRFNNIPFGEFDSPKVRKILTKNNTIITDKGIFISWNQLNNRAYIETYGGAPHFNVSNIVPSPKQTKDILQLTLQSNLSGNECLFLPAIERGQEDLFTYYFLDYVAEQAKKKDVFANVLQEVLKAEVDVEKEEDKRFEKIVSSLKENIVAQEIAKNKAYRKAIEEEQQKRLEMVKKGTTPGKKKSKKKRKGKVQRINRTEAKVVSVKEKITSEIMESLEKKHHTYKDFAGTLFNYLKKKGIKEVRENIKGSHHNFHIEGEMDGQQVHTGTTIVKPHGRNGNKMSHKSVKRTVGKLAASLQQLLEPSAGEE